MPMPLECLCYLDTKMGLCECVCLTKPKQDGTPKIQQFTMKGSHPKPFHNEDSP